MKNIISQIENAQMQEHKIPDFRPGDTVVVQVKVKEGNRERLQAFEGVVIAVRHRGLNSAFTVRKVTQGEGVERVFQTYSPLIASIKIKRRGDIRRAKLYYLRELSGRAARIKEKISAQNKLKQQQESKQTAEPSQAKEVEAKAAETSAPKTQAESKQAKVTEPKEGKAKSAESTKEPKEVKTKSAESAESGKTKEEAKS